MLITSVFTEQSFSSNSSVVPYKQFIFKHFCIRSINRADLDIVFFMFECIKRRNLSISRVYSGFVWVVFFCSLRKLFRSYGLFGQCLFSLSPRFYCLSFYCWLRMATICWLFKLYLSLSFIQFCIWSVARFENG